MRAAIFGDEEDDGCQDSFRAGCPFGKGGDGREESTSELHTSLKEVTRNFLKWVGRIVGGTHQFACRGFGCLSFDNRDCFLFGLRSAQLRGCCRFGLELLRPGRLTGGRHFRLFKYLRDQLV